MAEHSDVVVLEKLYLACDQLMEQADALYATLLLGRPFDFMAMPMAGHPTFSYAMSRLEDIDEQVQLAIQALIWESLDPPGRAILLHTARALFDAYQTKAQQPQHPDKIEIADLIAEGAALFADPPQDVVAWQALVDHLTSLSVTLDSEATGEVRQHLYKVWRALPPEVKSRPGQYVRPRLAKEEEDRRSQ